MLFSHFGDRLLPGSQSPLTRENATILVAVTVSQHDLLGGCVRVCGDLMISFRYRMRKIRIDDAGRIIEILQRFKERHNLQRASRTAVDFLGQAGLAGKEMDQKQIRKLPRHADNERSKPRSAVPAMLCKDAVAIPYRIRLGTS